MNITILGSGTSQGVPVIACNCNVCKSENLKDKRLRSSVLIEVDNQKIVVDTGPDFRQQMLNENVENISAVLLTHEHKDHIAGLDDVRAFNHRWKKDMDIYCSENVEIALKREFHYVFSDFDYPGVPKLKLNLFENKDFYIKKTKITPIQVMHYKLPVFGFRIKDFVYITDVSYISDKEKEKIKGAKVLVIDALRKKEHISHFSLNQALELIDEVKVEKSYLTHISHFMGKHNDLLLELPDNVLPAFDGLKIEMNE